MVKKVIGLVVGDLYSTSLLYSFAHLSKKYEVKIFLNTSEHILSRIPKSFAPYLFKEDKSIPGYIKNLEKKLSDLDIVVCMNFGSLMTLQVAKFCEEKKVPLIAYVPDLDLSVYDSYHNLKSIQDLMIEVANHFIVPYEGVKKQLMNIGVKKEKIQTYSPKLNPDIFFKEALNKANFRKYLNFSNQDIVIMYHGPLEQTSNPHVLLKAIKLLEAFENSIHKKIKILYAGQGRYDLELKYLSWNLGLGDQTYFLNQNTSPFWHELLKSCDMLVIPENTEKDRLVPYPFHVIEALACGVLPIVSGNMPEAQFVGEDFCFKDNCYQSLSTLISKILSSPKMLKSYKDIAIERKEILENLSVNSLESFFYNFIEGLEEKNIPVAWEVLDGNSRIFQYAQSVIDETKFLYAKLHYLKDKSKLLCIQAQAFVTLKNFDEATKVYDQALKYDVNNVSAFSGKGYLMWQCYMHEDAMKFFKKGLAIAPDHSECMLGIGLVYKRIGMLTDAVYWIEKAILFGASCDLSMRALVQACSESKNIDFAIAAMERVVEIVGENEVLMRGLAQHYMKAGHIEIGSKILNKYLDK